MSIEPLPFGFGESFSIAMDPSLATLWPTTPPPPPPPPPTLQDLQSVEEAKQRLAAATTELEAARGVMRLREQNIAGLTDLIRRTAQERDLLRQQHQLLLARELEAMTSSQQASATPPTAACPLPSSSLSPVAAIDGAAMFTPFAAPTSAAAVHRRSPVAAVDGAAMFTPFVEPASAAVNKRSPMAVVTPLAVPTSAAVNKRSPMAVVTPLAVPARVDRTSPVAVVTPFAVPTSAAIDRRSPVTAVTPFAVPTSAAVDRSTAAAAAALEVPRPTMVTPFTAPTSAAVDRSMAAALEVPRPTMVTPFAVPTSAPVDRSTAAPALEVPRPAMFTSFAAPTGLEVPRFAGLVVDDESRLAALELQAAKRPPPQKGRLVQAVMEAGPLLQNLMVTGPLPQWRNPPPAQALADAMVSVPSSSSAPMPMALPWSIH